LSIDFNLLKPSASMEMTRVAAELKKMGKTIYPLSIGDTHFPPPAAIVEKLQNINPKYSHYTNAEGIELLRNQIAEKYNGYNAKDVILVPGLKQGLYYALESLQERKLCILEPAWLGYNATAILAGYETIAINMQKDDWSNQLQSAEFNVIIVNAPNNPDGKIFNEIETQQIISAARKNDAWIITDFIYSRYDYEKTFSSFYNIIVQYPKIIIGSGFSKSHAMTGFRIGYLLCKDEQVMQKMIIMQQNLATCVTAISQYLLIDFSNADNEVENYVHYYKKNRDLILSIFPEWERYKPHGGFYYFVDLKPYGIINAELFCEEVLKQDGIALVPGTAYGKYCDSFIRISFSIDTTELTTALDLLRQQLKK